MTASENRTTRLTPGGSRATTGGTQEALPIHRTGVGGVSSRPPFDAEASTRLDALEDAAVAVHTALVFLWPAARRHGAVAQMIGPGVRALAVLNRERDALEREAGL